MNELNVLLITVSIRKDRQSPKASAALLPILESNEKIAITEIDLAEWDLPMYTDEDPAGRVIELLEAYKKADGIIIVTPEYNHSLPSPLKNMIDFAVDRELYGKPLAIVGASDGPYGGVRVIKELVHVWHGVGGLALPVFLPTPHVDKLDPEQLPEDWKERAEKFVERSLYWFRVVKAGKETVN